MNEENILADICDGPVADVVDIIPIENSEAVIEDSSEPEGPSTDTVEEGASESNADTTEALKAEILTLKTKISELEAEKNTQARLVREISDFNSLFPEVDINSVPDSVWESVKQGIPLCASYAVYEKRIMAEEARISQINNLNVARSAGIAGRDAANEYFSPDEVRRMSSSEVHANYHKIKESMKKWI